MIKEKDEVWRTVPNYEDYMVSDRGRVKSLKFGKDRLIKLPLRKDGYIQISLSKKGVKKFIRIHQLVAMTFSNHIPCSGEVEVHHIDGDTINNNLSNLEVLTIEEHKAKTHDKTSANVGVCYESSTDKWKAYIRIEGKQKHIGRFKDEVSAIEAYKNYLKNN